MRFIFRGLVLNLMILGRASFIMWIDPNPDDPDGAYIQTHFDPRGQCQDVNNCTRQECCKPEAPDPDTYCDNSEPDLTNAFMEDFLKWL